MPNSPSHAPSASTRLCAVYGHPIRHSASPAMQNAGIAALGLDWRYLAFDVHPDALPQALAGAAAMRFIGVNLTVPHKLLALDLMQVLDPSAQLWGAVNTVRFEGRSSSSDWLPLAQLDPETVLETRLHGFNTDADALLRALREDLNLEPRNARILLLGAGGAGRVAALRLAAEGAAHLWLVNRSESKAADLAQEIARLFPHSPTRVSLGYPDQSIDLVLNATSAGLKPEDPLPLDPSRLDLASAQSAYDMIYRPAQTPFLRAAAQAGCRTANGLGMLLYQGAAALEIWSGHPAPIAPMRQALWTNIYGKVA